MRRRTPTVLQAYPIATIDDSRGNETAGIGMPKYQHVRLGVRRSWVLWSFGLAVAAYLLSPLLFSQHLEGYTANLRSIALTWERGELATQDAIMPVITQYLFLTRVGIVLLLRLVDGVFGPAGDAGFRGLTMASFVLLSLSSAALARREGKLGWPACLAGVLLIQGLIEVGSFFNDNIISAALGVAALALVSRSSGILSCAMAGALLGMAMLCRTDAVLLCPAAAGLVWLHHDRLGPILGRGTAMLGGVLLVFLLMFALTGVTMLDALRISGDFFPSKIGIVYRAIVASLFFGAPALALLAIGLVLNVRHHLASRNLRWGLVFLAYPAAVAGLAVLRLSTEVRYLYPLLAPFCLVHVARGVEWLAGSLSRPGLPRRAGWAVMAALALLMVLPPVAFVRDGPHSVVGRIWMPLLWFRWQDSVAQSLRRIDALAAAAETNTQTLVLSTHFNDDFFLKLRLLDHGFRIIPAEAVFAECQGGFSAYQKSGHLVTHLRTENQYQLIPLPTLAVRSLQIQRALQCPRIWQFDQAYLTLAGRDVRVPNPPLDVELFGSVIPRLPPLYTLSTSFAGRSSVQGALALLHFGPPDAPTPATPMLSLMAEIHTLPISRTDLQEIEARADLIMAETNLQRAEGTLHAQAPFTYEDFIDVYRRRF